MKFPSRLFVCATAAILCILYIGWLRPSSHIRDNIQTVWKGTAHRLVVFGDDWSDTGKYRVSPPPKSTIVIRDPDRGDLWTEVLCKELNCDFIDNFARSVPSALDLAAVGSLVDSDIYANATADRRKETLAVFDFQTQVQQFIEYESKNKWVSGRLRKVDEWAVFTVFFGLWDILNYAELEKQAALHAIDRSIEELFHNLDILADHVGGPLKVVVPKLVDVTFLPCFQARKNTTQGEFAPHQHQSVVMWKYWNTALSQAAAKWKKGIIHMPDLNHLLVDQIRATQLHSEKISDASGNGKQAPLFDEVKQPCLLLKTADSTGDLQPVGVEKCFDPARHLFWDSVHLSGPAHQLIGKEAARLVHGNETVNIADSGRRKQGSITNQNDKQTKDDGFNLKLAPGY